MIVRLSLTLVTVLSILCSGATYGGTITFTVGTPTAAGMVEFFPALKKGKDLVPLVGAPTISTYDITKGDLRGNPQKALFDGLVADLKKETGDKHTYSKINFESDPKKFTITLSNLGVAGFDGIAVASMAAGIKDQKLQAKDDPTVALVNWGTEPNNPTGSNRFDLNDVNGHNTTFTAGVVTDNGPAVLTLSASAFPVTTDPITGQKYIAGSDIAQVFYNDLSPLVAAIGAGIALNGAELDFNFAPGSTSSGGGGIGGGEVDFGTTSVDGAITAGIDATVPEPGGLVLVLTGLLALLAMKSLGLSDSQVSRETRRFSSAAWAVFFRGVLDTWK